VYLDSVAALAWPGREFGEFIQRTSRPQHDRV